MVIDADADFFDHIIQESVGRKGGTGFDFQDDLAAAAVDFIHEVAGFTDPGDQVCHHILGGLADQAVAACDD